MIDLAIRQFVHLASDEAAPDHSTISRTRRLIDLEAHRAVFTSIQQRLAEAGLLKGKTVAIDATTLEANAAMRSIVRRDTGEGYQEFLTRLAPLHVHFEQDEWFYILEGSSIFTSEMHVSLPDRATASSDRETFRIPGPGCPRDDCSRCFSRRVRWKSIPDTRGAADAERSADAGRAETPLRRAGTAICEAWHEGKGATARHSAINQNHALDRLASQVLRVRPALLSNPREFGQQFSKRV